MPEEITAEKRDDPPGASFSERQLGGRDGISVGAGDPTSSSGKEQAQHLDDEFSSSGKAHTRPVPMGSGGGGDGGSAPGEGNPVERGGGGGRGSRGRWVVTMMVPGRKLWDSSPAMMSQYKRFRRSRQDPKIARDQVCGTYTTKIKPLPFNSEVAVFLDAALPSPTTMRENCMDPRSGTE